MSILDIHFHFSAVYIKQVIKNNFRPVGILLLVWSISVIQCLDLSNKSKYLISPQLANIIFQGIV